ncbi:helix-turn-helix domain-containing protein [Flavobacterium sp. TMP13]|uniref:helix-turn-helix domain-containing protein n=1 Tax=unclassified Flavobacterium TaxID=196869 RepID=UPI00076D91E4|nr:helix-turn-helix domain-containing protein [Flavobacterium sp. TAB 87]KVV16197.1 DNA binding domain, excisionase family [Flavobacterium sp. TAB 87]
MKQYTFEDLPTILSLLVVKMDKIEQLLIEQKCTKESDQQELMGIEGAATLLKLSVATIYSKVCRKELPVSKKGKRLYFNKTELLDWIKSGRIKTICELKTEIEKKYN